MNLEMFEPVKEDVVDGRVKSQDRVQLKFYYILDRINAVLSERTHSPSELYDELIYRRVVKPGYFRDFKRILRLGIREGLLRKDRLFSKVSISKKFPNFFTKEQLINYFWACNDVRIAMASLLALYCGLRTGEVIKIKTIDIDFNVCLIKLVQTKGRKDRMAPFIPAIHTIVRKWIKYVGSAEYLFPSFEHHSIASIGQDHISEKTLTDGFNKALREAKLDTIDVRYGYRRSKHSFYAFRHTFATLSIERRTPPEIVQRAMGHVKIDTTLSTYTHIRNPVMVESIAKAFNGQKAEACKAEVPVRVEGVFDLLAKKFALGEIDEAEFLRRKQFLAAHGLA